MQIVFTPLKVDEMSQIAACLKATASFSQLDSVLCLSQHTSTSGGCSDKSTENQGATFSAFPELPAEIRREIWHIALSQSWSGNVYDGRRERRKLEGVFHRQVGLSCREAQHIFKSRAVYMANFHMWIDTSCHVFYLRSPLCPRELGPAQHVVLNPVGWHMLFVMVEMVGECCKSLRTLVVVAPWAQVQDMPADQTPESWEPLEDWRMICSASSQEEHQARLVYDIESSGVVDETRNAEYCARLDEVAQRLDKSVHGREHVFGRLLGVLRRLDNMLSEFSGTTPRLYLRTVSQLRAS